MKDKHIINLLEENKIKDLSEADAAFIAAHVEQCADCRREYEAARVAQMVLKTRAAQTLEPPPFFEARVMNAWRERQAAPKPVADRIRQMWQDTKILVSGLATSVAVLTILTFVVPQGASDTLASNDYYSLESVVFEHPDQPADLTDEQLLEEIYGSDDLEN
jgi:predicted anti-sigma-YlaC factor YlaD